MHPFIEDLRFAQQAHCAVELYFYGQPRKLTGIIDVDDAHEIVTFHDPQTFGDSRTRRRAALSDIASVTVLADMDYSFNENDG